MTMWLLMLSCTSPAAWTTSQAVTGVRERIDADHDGHVDATEWRTVAPYGSVHADADHDRDGNVSADELVNLALRTDPGPWLERARQTDTRMETTAMAEVAGAPKALTPTSTVLLTLLEQVPSASGPSTDAKGGADSNLPTRAEIDGVRDLPIHDPRVQAILRRLRAIARARGVPLIIAPELLVQEGTNASPPPHLPARPLQSP